MGRYRRYQLQVALRGEAMTATDESRMAFGIDLWTTKNRFFRLEGVDMPYGRIRTSSEYVTTVFGDGTEVSYREDTIKVSDKIGINAQVGYRVFPNTIARAGLIESAGGIGIDHTLKLGKRPMILVFEAYDFAREFDQGVHLKFEGRYFISPHVFLTAGWDDPLVSEKSSVLFGAGINWNDDDVKYSLGLAGSALN